MCSKEEVKEAVKGEVAPIKVSVSHIAKSVDDIKSHLERLPCNDLSGRLGKLESELEFRVKTYEKEAERREEEIQGAFNLARSKPDKTDLEKLEKRLDKAEDKKDVKMWGVIILFATFILNAVGYLLR
jgi:hypothetical protein